MYFPKSIARISPYLKFIVALVTAVAMAVTVPLGSPLWLTISIAVLNALGVFLTPNMQGEYEYREPTPEFRQPGPNERRS